MPENQLIIQLNLDKISVCRYYMSDLLSHELGMILDKKDAVGARYVDASQDPENYLMLSHASKLTYCQYNGEISKAYIEIASCYVSKVEGADLAYDDALQDYQQALLYFQRALLQGRDDIFDEKLLAYLAFDPESIDSPLLRGFAALLSQGDKLNQDWIKGTLKSVHDKDDKKVANLLIGIMYHRGIAGAQDPKQAKKYLMRAYDEQVAMAAQLLGDICLVKGQYYNARHYFHQARKSCLPQAHAKLAYMHDKHLRSPFSGYAYFIPDTNLDKTQKYYDLAAIQGYPCSDQIDSEMKIEALDTDTEIETIESITLD